MEDKIRSASQFIFLIASVGIIGYVLLHNLAPLGVTTIYNLTENNKNLSPLGPKDRVTQSQDNTYQQNNDLVYFTTAMPFKFDSATVTMTYQNPSPDQTISLGFQDQDTWHYNIQPFDVPVLNTLSWSTIGTNPILYQKTKKYNSVNNFLSSPPQNAIIGTYNYDIGIKDSKDEALADYIPSNTPTVIDTPLRGKVVLYAYLHNEPFHLNIEKQDLNWYPDPDVVDIKVYKDTDQVFSAEIDDDGITDGSKRVTPAQSIDISNPGPGLPENGIYKIVINAGSDAIIKKITTNLHKIVFQGPIFLAGNSMSYQNVISSTSATILYTNALTLSALTYHVGGLQAISIGNQYLILEGTKHSEVIVPQDNFSKIVVPQNDVILNGFQGYFALTPDNFFLPSKYKQIAINNSDDADLADYIIADYSPSKKIGDFEQQTKTFDLTSAFIKNGRLSWLISAPGLKDNNGQIIIKDISVVFKKKPIFK